MDPIAPDDRGAYRRLLMNPPGGDELPEPSQGKNGEAGEVVRADVYRESVLVSAKKAMAAVGIWKSTRELLQSSGPSQRSGLQADESQPPDELPEVHTTARGLATLLTRFGTDVS